MHCIFLCHNIHYWGHFYVTFKRTDYIIVLALIFGLFYNFGYELGLTIQTDYSFDCSLTIECFLIGCIWLVVENAYTTKMASSRKIHCRIKNSGCAGFFSFPVKGKAIGNVICADI